MKKIDHVNKINNLKTTSLFKKNYEKKNQM
jgi:hypothetical protein